MDAESLFNVAEGPWEVVEWAFYVSVGGWRDVVDVVCRILRNDLEMRKPGASTRGN